MTPATLRTVLSGLELTNGRAARLIGVSDRTVRNWLSGDRQVPASAVRLLRLMELSPSVRGLLDHIAEKPGIM